MDGDETLLARGARDDRRAVALGVGDEIAKAALERQWPHLDLEIAVAATVDARAVPLRVVAQLLEVSRRSVAAVGSPASPRAKAR